MTTGTGIATVVIVAILVSAAYTAIRNMIRESKVHQIDTVIYSSAADGMMTMDSSLQKLYEEGRISKKNALLYSLNPDILARRLN